MKEKMSAMLCVMLALAMMMGAFAAEGDVMVAVGTGMTINESIGSYCTIGDTLYMTGIRGEKLYSHTAGEPQPRTYSLDLGVEPGFNQSVHNCVLADGGRLMLLSLLNDYSGEKETCTARLYELSITSDQVEATLLSEPDWSFMYLEDENYYSYVEGILGADGYALIVAYDNQGNNVIFRLDYTTGKTVRLSLENIVCITQYTDGKILAEQFDYDEPETVRFLVCDPMENTSELLSEMTVEQYEYFGGLACNAETGEVYFVRGGEIIGLDVEAGAIKEAVNNIFDNNYTPCGASITPGGYYAHAAYNAYTLRSVVPDKTVKDRLVICDVGYLDSVEKTYFEFSNANGDVSVVLDRDSGSDALIDSMLSRDSSVDIYIMNSTDSAFEAVSGRGFMMSLESSRTLSDLAARMYPNVLEQLSANGEFAALPVEIYIWLPFFHGAALEKLGLTVDDVPRNWSDFIDFLIELQEIMPQDGSISLMDPWTSVQYARQELFMQIFECYQMQLKQDSDAVDNRTMVDILRRLEQIDFERLGQPDESVVSDESYNPEYDESRFLLTTNMGTSLSGVSVDGIQAVPMALTADCEPRMPLEFWVAFVNPYSENSELALEFVEMLAQNLSEDVLYCVCPGLNDPVLDPYYEENLRYYEEYLASLEEEIENAQAADRQMLEEQLERGKLNLEERRQDKYRITEADIAWIRTYGEQIVLSGSNWLYSAEGGSAYDLAQQYLQGKIDADRLMKEIDSKIRMMLMEGY